MEFKTKIEQAETIKSIKTYREKISELKKENEKSQALNCELVDELNKTRTAIKNGLEFGYIQNCEYSEKWLKRVEQVLEKAKVVSK